MPRVNDTPEEVRIRAEIKAKGIKNLSPAMVLRVSKTELEPFVLEGRTDQEICSVFNVSHAPITALRKFYDLPTVSEVRKMDECIQEDEEVEIRLNKDGTPGGIKKEPDEVLECEITLTQEDDGRVTSGEMKAEAVKKALEGTPLEDVQTFTATEMQTYDPPLLSIKTTGTLAAPLVNGIAKYLDKLGDEEVEVEVRVRPSEGK